MISTLKRLAIAVLLAASFGVVSAAPHIGPRGSVSSCRVTVHPHLNGHHEVPPAKTDAWGNGVINVRGDGTVTGKITVHGMRGTMAHIHQGGRGTNGPPIITLLSGPHGTWLVPPGSKLTPKQRDMFCTGGLYLNVHSAKHPGGEIRAQL